MRSGKLRNRVEVQANVATTASDADAYGDVPEKWETIATRWAEVTQQDGRENWQADQVRPDVTVQVRMRWVEGVTPRHRLKLGTRILNVSSVVDPDGRRRELVLGCKEEV